MLLVLWDIDGTLVDSAGHGRHAFEEAFEAVVGGVPDWVEYAGRTDHQIALAMLNG
jgi:phosphoglycolate phosphatase-like HAD superfamily hydrolase